MRMRFYVVMLTSSEGATPFPVFTKDAPTLQEMLENSESFAEAWKGEKPMYAPDEETVTGWTTAEDASHKFSVAGPYKSPRLHDTYVAIRPGAFFGRVAVQALSKSSARSLINHTFGPVAGMRITKMVPFTTRILAPVL